MPVTIILAVKVMVWVITRLLARGYGFFNGFFKASPMVVTQERLQFAGTPIFSTVIVGLFQTLETATPNLGKILLGHCDPPIHSDRY